jgi:SAM-dependent methyltransferase
MKKYWIKKREKGKIIWRRGRAQGIEDAKGRNGDIRKLIKDLLKKKEKVKVLEVGAGFGRALLELKRIFGNRIETCGTNFELEWNKKLCREYALDQGFDARETPKIYAKIDAGKKLPFKGGSFDFNAVSE